MPNMLTLYYSPLLQTHSFVVLACNSFIIKLVSYI